MWTDNIEKPTLILDSAKCRANIQRMADRARRNRVKFRPHCKTHQSADIGEWFRAVNVDAITVSSVEMAMYFAAHGWNDITIAFTVNTRQIKGINSLLSKQVKLGLIVESIETVKVLQKQLQHPVQVWLDIDTGYHRTGIDWQATAEIVELARTISNSPQTMTLGGLLGHAGHTYEARSLEQVQSIHDETVRRMSQVRDLLATNDMTGLAISLGDTPSCSMLDDLGGLVDEIRPGNFLFYDTMQANIGSNKLTDVAVTVACPVVARNVCLQQIVVYGGAVHLSKDRIVDSLGRTNFGYLAKPTEAGWEIIRPNTCYVKGLSQEHGLIHADAELLNSTKIGDILLIIPIHSCLTANLLKKYQLLEGGSISMAPIPNTAS